MRIIVRVLVAFCVATVLAQGIILLLAGIGGNLKRESLLKAVALLNGVDISGDQLQQMLDDARAQPIPTYEDVRDSQAEKSKNLQMREAAIERNKQMTEEMLSELRTKVADFDRRKDEFYKLMEEKEQSLLDQSLKEVQRTLEVLAPEQAKEQVIKLIEANEMDDVVAIFKEMPLDKRKKIMGEFTAQEEVDMLHDILMRTRQGEPTAGVIQNARQQAPTQ